MPLPSMRPNARRLADASSRAVRRAAADAWPLLQGTAAGTAAWVIAKYVLDHEQPFFAPIAALIALNTSLGERGLNAVRLLQGVIVGILVGELALGFLGASVGSLALAVFVSTSLARALGGPRITLAQAAVSAILIVALADADAGVARLLDALTGAGVALVFSQLLFSPEPVALLRRAEAAALAGMADGLQLAARALAEGDRGLAEQATSDLRELRDRLGELNRLRRATTRVARRSLVWRSRVEPVVQEKENADYLDLLGGSCVILARSTALLTPAERSELEPSVRELADALDDLAGGLGDRSTRQHAADRALEVTRRVGGRDAPPDSNVAFAIVAVRLAATDLMVFAGVDVAEAIEAVRAGISEAHVTNPPPPERFTWRRWLRLPFEQRRRRRAS
ncbi:MAG: FUSC family protein [Actinomycetota bacterium]|nr:FUSC family protein [Actinomycetota bacterium]